MRSYWKARTAAFAFALLAGGCDTAGSTARGPVALSTASTAGGFAPIWVNTDLQPIGPVKTIGAVVVGITVKDFKMFLVGIDPATGRELWHQQMAHSFVTPGETVSIVAIGPDKVAYLRPREGDGYAQLVVADARSGNDRASSPPTLFTSWPYACANGRDACAISHGNLGGRERHYRLDVASDDYIADGEALPNGARILMEPGLLDLGDRPGNTLAWLRDGKLQWRTPISAAFPPGFSSDYGWEWHAFAEQKVFVGSVFGPPSGFGRARERDLSSAATAGLSEATGEVLWRDKGSDFQCHLADRDHPVRCRFTGTAHTDDNDVTFDRLAVTVEGFDPMTGKTTWSQAMGAATSLLSSRYPLAIAGPARVVVNGPRGPVVLDYAAGRVTPPAPGATFWCLTSARYDTYPAYRPGGDGPSATDRPGGHLAAICDGQGRPAIELPSAEATIAAGAQVGSYVVIAAARGYVGFRVPSR